MLTVDTKRSAKGYPLQLEDIVCCKYFINILEIFHKYSRNISSAVKVLYPLASNLPPWGLGGSEDAHLIILCSSDKCLSKYFKAFWSLGIIRCFATWKVSLFLVLVEREYFVLLEIQFVDSLPLFQSLINISVSPRFCDSRCCNHLLISNSGLAYDLL